MGGFIGTRLRGCATGCALQVAALGWLGVVAVVFALLYPHLPRDAQSFIAPLALGTWFGTLLPAILLGGGVVIVRRNGRLDDAFAGLGPGRTLAPVARSWAAEVGGRQVNAWFSKGPQLEIYVAAAPRTDVAVGRRGPLMSFAGRLTDRDEVPLSGEFVAMGADDAWTRRMVADGGARTALVGLLEGDALRAVHVQPDAVKLSVRGFDHGALDRADVDRLVARLLELARAVDALPAPASPMAPGGLASGLRTNRGSLGMKLGIGLGCTFAGLVLAVGVALIVVLATGA